MHVKFTCRDKLVSGGQKTSPPSSITYSNVVTSENVSLAFVIASLNNLYICACDIGNAYLNYPCLGKMWIKAGSEFRSEKRYVFLIVRSLYGIKSSGAAWRAKLVETLN